MEQHKFFLYARKSTDVEDKQMRSIEDQIAELRAFAKQENLNIVDVLIEKQSAKIPGRPIFGEMIRRVEAGEANGILAWHPLCQPVPVDIPIIAESWKNSRGSFRVAGIF